LKNPNNPESKVAKAKTVWSPNWKSKVFNKSCDK
jgi:hypothetical protein